MAATPPVSRFRREVMAPTWGFRERVGQWVVSSNEGGEAVVGSFQQRGVTKGKAYEGAKAPRRVENKMKSRRGRRKPPRCVEKKENKGQLPPRQVENKKKSRRRGKSPLVTSKTKRKADENVRILKSW